MPNVTVTRQRVRGLTIATAIVLAVVYALAAWAFGRSLSGQEIREITPPVSGVAVTIVATTIDPTEPLAKSLVVVQPAPNLLTPQGLLKQSILVQVTPSLEGQSLTYEAGTLPTSRPISLPLRGRVQNYPFDSYRGSFAVSALAVRDVADAGHSRRIPVQASVSFRDPGWRLTSSTTQPDPYSMTFNTEISRAGSTVSISILLLALMLCLAVLATWAATSVVSGAIPAQISVAGWMAALLFALIPIRTFLPGSPPVGSWIDILVFFWVEVGVMLAMVVVVVAMLRRARSEHIAELSGEARETREAGEAQGAREAQGAPEAKECAAQTPEPPNPAP